MYVKRGFKNRSSWVILSLVHLLLLDGCDAPDTGMETELEPSTDQYVSLTTEPSLIPKFCLLNVFSRNSPAI